MKLAEKIAYQWLKKAAPISIPPKMLQKTRDFMISTYAGHVLARTRSKIEAYQQNKLEGLKERREEFAGKVNKALEMLRERVEFDMRIPLYIKGNYLLMSYDPDERVFSYKWDRETGRSTRTYEVDVRRSTYKAREKIYNARKKEVTNFAVKINKIEKLKANDSKLVSLIMLEKQARKIADRAKAYKGSARKTIDINLDGWKYLDKNSPLETLIKEKERIIEDLKDAEDKIIGDRERLELWLDSDPQVGDKMRFTHDVDTKTYLHEQRIKTNTLAMRVIENEENTKVISIPEFKQTYPIGSELKEDYRYMTDSELRVIESRKRRLSEAVSEFKQTELEDLLENKGWTEITLVLFFKAHKRRGGVWKPQDRQLEVDVFHAEPDTADQFFDEIENIQDTIEHELRHFAQYVLQEVKALGEKAGLPSPETRSPSHNEHGQRAPGRRQTQPHALRDIEFQTRLGDEIRRFVRSVKGKVQAQDVREFFRVWTAQDQNPGSMMNLKYDLQPSRFYRMLKENQPQKWEEAVKELFKEAAKKGVDFGGEGLPA